MVREIKHGMVVDDHLGGYCRCGCGKPTRIATATKRSREHVKGLPMPFLTGHYRREERDPADILVARRYVDQDTGCWEWTGSRLPAGYGKVMWRGRKTSVHRLAAVAWMGFDLGSDLLVLHHCDNPCCFNPEHLFIGTQADNIADMVAKGRQRNRGLHGESNHSARLTAKHVEQIRKLWSDGWLRSDIAKSFGMSWSQTARICAGESWNVSGQ